jgi:hypothetical protein
LSKPSNNQTISPLNKNNVALFRVKAMASLNRMFLHYVCKLQV